MNTDQERAEFEAWYAQEYPNETAPLRHGSEYFHRWDNRLFRAYQAGRSAVQAQSNDWVNTSDALPEPYQEVYAKHKDGNIRIARISRASGGCWQLATFLSDTKRPGYVWPIEDVTEWRAINSPHSQDREDAERFRFLRDNAQLFSHFGDIGNSGWCVMRRDHTIRRVFTYNGHELIDAIDHARRIEEDQDGN